MNLLTKFENILKDKRTIDENGCWLYDGCLTPRGYGQFKLKGKCYRVHRISYWYHNNKELPKYNPKTKSQVNHKCHNPRCFNPECLYLGTHQDNMNDRMNEGNYEVSIKARNNIKLNHPRLKGEKHSRASITDSQAKFIKYHPLLYIRGGMKHLSKENNISYSVIKSIKYGRRWSHI